MRGLRRAAGGRNGFGGSEDPVWVPRAIPGLILGLRPDMGVTTTTLTLPDINAGGWVSDAVTQTLNQLDPFGGNAAVFVKEDGTTASHDVYSNPSTTGDGKGTRSIRVYAKMNGRRWISVVFPSYCQFWVDLQTGALGTVTVVGGDTPRISVASAGNGWWRIDYAQDNIPRLIYTADHVKVTLATADGGGSYAGDNASGVYLYGITLTTAGVSAWVDQSGVGDSNHNVAQATLGTQPGLNAASTAYGGRPTVRFDSSLHALLAAGNWSSPPAVDLSIYVVGHTGPATALLSDHGSGVPYNMLYAVSATAYPTFYSTSYGNVYGASAALNTPRCILQEHTSTTTKVFVDNTASSPIINTTRWWDTIASHGIDVGMGAGGISSANGQIAEILVYKRILTSSEKAILARYFATRYNLGII